MLAGLTALFTNDRRLLTKARVKTCVMVTSAVDADYEGHAEFYDGFFSWYLDGPESPGADLARLLGPTSGSGWVLDVCCGTGLSGGAAAAAGWRVGGVDVSADQLRLAVPRLGWVVQSDARRLPFASNSVERAMAMFAHTDVGDFATVVAEVARVLRPGGRFAYLGVHPCFVGPHIDSPAAGDVLSVTPGYQQTRWVPAAEFDRPRFGAGIRRRVGAWHVPLGALLSGVLEAGLVLERVIESGDDSVPWRLGLVASKP